MKTKIGIGDRFPIGCEVRPSDTGKASSVFGRKTPALGEVVGYSRDGVSVRVRWYSRSSRSIQSYHEMFLARAEIKESL